MGRIFLRPNNDPALLICERSTIGCIWCEIFNFNYHFRCASVHYCKSLDQPSLCHKRHPQNRTHHIELPRIIILPFLRRQLPALGHNDDHCFESKSCLIWIKFIEKFVNAKVNFKLLILLPLIPLITILQKMAIIITSLLNFLLKIKII